jgi:hypothetical protein
MYIVSSYVVPPPKRISFFNASRWNVFAHPTEALSLFNTQDGLK